MDLVAAQELILRMLEARRLTGAVVGVRARGDAAFVTAGRAMEDPFRARVPLFCASKPLLASALLELLELNSLSVDMPIGNILSGSTGRSWALPIRGLLSHTGGIPSSVGPMNPAGHYLEIANRALWLGPRADLTGTLFYSHTAAWCIVALLVEKLSGVPFHEAVQRRVLERLQITGISYTLPSAAPLSAPTEISTNPHPAAPIDTRNPNPAWGGFGTAPAMLDFYEQASRALGDPDLPLAATFARMTTPTLHPGSRGRRPRSFGLGMFVDMQSEGASSACGPRNFGHGASVRFGEIDKLTSIFWSDLTNDIVACVILDGHPSHGDARFPAIARALYNDLENRQM